MLKYSIAILALFGSFVILASSRSVSSASIIPVFAKDEYNQFFRTLSGEEQQWIMKLTAWYHDAGKKGSYSQKKVKSIPVPLPGNEDDQDIPENLIGMFLNGDVPSKWQKEFIKWLKKEYNLKDANFEKFKATGVFCDEGDSCSLANLDNIGGICCPFG